MSVVSVEKPKFGWKEAIIGGFITLVVTTLAGVGVWVFTRDPDNSEKLIYRVEAPGLFSAQGRNVGLQAVSVRNDGRTKADGVVIDVSIPNGTRILDKYVSFSSGKSVAYQEKKTPDGMSIAVPAFLPKEKAAISFLTSGSSGRPLVFSVRSQQQIASREQQSEQASGARFSVKLLLIILVVSMVAQYLATQYLGYRKFRKRRSEFLASMVDVGAYSPSRNNLGFLLMHNELLDEAEEVFWEDIRRGSAELMTLSHYGALLAMKGDAKASQYFQASEWPGADDHDRANLHLDKFIKAAHGGDVVNAKLEMASSLKLSNSVRTYYSSSKLLKSLASKCGLNQFLFDELAKY